MQVQSNIPEVLRPPAEAALAWLNQTERRSYELSGVVDCEGALQVLNERLSSGASSSSSVKSDDGFELGLVLCDGEICKRQQISVQAEGDEFSFSLVTAGARDIPALLDPPETVRSDWLAGVLGKHEFVLLLFYRGLW